MRCRHVEYLLARDPASALTGRRGSAVAAHLRDCHACRRLQEEYLAVEQEVRAVTALYAGPRPGLRRRAIDRWMAECSAMHPRRAGGSARLGFLTPTRWALPVAAAGLLLVVLGLKLAQREDERPSRPRAVSLAQARRPHPPASALPKATPPALDHGARRFVAAPPRSSAPPVRVPWLSQQAPPVAPDAGRSRPTRAERRPSPGRLSSLGSETLQDAQHEAMPPEQQWEKLEEDVRRAAPVRDDFVRIPFPQLATASDRQIAEAVASYKREAAVIDPRLAQRVTVQQKGTALSDLCERLRSETGIQLAAGQSVADEKVTLFCEKLPLREVMRQLSCPFGYTWLRSGKGRDYRYELVQDLQSQLLEEELRNRDRNEALLALDQELQRFRPYLGLSPDEALARSKTAPPAEKPLLEKLAGYGWGPIQMYFRLSAQDLVALRAGQRLQFRVGPGPGEQPLPPDLARGVLQSFRDWKVVKSGAGYRAADEAAGPDTASIPVPSVPEARAAVKLEIQQRELGRTALHGDALWSTPGSHGQPLSDSGVDNYFAEGMSPAVVQPNNATSNAKLARDPSLRARVIVRPRPTCFRAPDPNAAAGGTSEPKVTTADVLEALHQATGLRIVADFYIRLYKPEVVSVQNQPLFEALNHLADVMRLRWLWKDGWLQFRSTSYYDDRFKEVPNRLLRRWAASHRQHGALPLEELLEIAQLSDAQLDANDPAEGARDCFSLIEWDLARRSMLRPHARFLAQLTPAQRQEAQSVAGLSFQRMTLAQQQQFLSHLPLPEAGEHSLPELVATASLRIEYSQPGGFRWVASEGRKTIPGVPPMAPSPVRERTREAALLAARRLDARVQEEQILPSDFALRLQYNLGSRRTWHSTRLFCATTRVASESRNSSDLEENDGQPEAAR